MDNKYQHGKIYKIISPHTDCIYIGSTTEKTLACRMRGHRSNYREWKAGKRHYVTSFDMIETGNESIVLIEAYPCNSKDELRAREQHHIDLNEGLCINKLRAYQTPDAAHAYNNERLDCACGGSYTRQNLSTHIKTTAHRNHLAGLAINDRVKKRMEFRVAGVRGRDDEKFECACGGKYTRQNLQTHARTAKHRKHLENLAIIAA
jgi:hypothetical protein